MRNLAATLLALATLTSGTAAQSPGPAAMDSLLERLVGLWQMSGTVRGRPVSYHLEAKRVLAGRFVELHMLDVAQPPAYEARVFLGVDSANQRYLVHWLDRFGAGSSIPHGVGEARGDTVRFTFAYPTGPFRDTFVYDRPRNQWYFRLESSDSTGGWRLFAEYQVRRR